jgi:PAS domain-containing protein
MQSKLHKMNIQLKKANRELLEEENKLSESELKLRDSEALFRNVFNQATIGIAIGHSDNYIISRSQEHPSINPMFEKITGRTKEELAHTKWTEITHPDIEL